MVSFFDYFPIFFAAEKLQNPHKKLTNAFAYEVSELMSLIRFCIVMSSFSYVATAFPS